MAEIDESRRAARQGVLKGAKLVLSATSVVDCVVLNVSSRGARVRLPAMMTLPAQMTLCFRGGAAFTAGLRWARAEEVGLEWIGPASLTARAAAEAAEIAQAVARLDPAAVLATLRERRHFDDPRLALLAEDWQAAHARLLVALAAPAEAPDLFG